jgi:prepilin-type N-terminal cleavage/methylation domain-containing protein
MGEVLVPIRSHRQRGFTLIELMTVVVILAVLAVVAVGAYSKHIRNARKTEVVSDLSNLTLRQKTFLAKAGHYASSAACDTATCMYPTAAALTAAEGPVYWDPNADEYTAGSASGAFFRGGPAVHGFDALQFMPEGGDSWCGYGTVSGWGSQAEAASADVPGDVSDDGVLVTAEFPAGTEAYSARDWFVSFALCDFDFDGQYWAFTTTHYNATVNMGSIGAYLENE